MRQCIFIIGTRAQLVKMAPVLILAKELELSHSVWLSGQHSESIDDLIRDFKLELIISSANKAAERSTITGLLLWIPIAFLGCYRFVRAVVARTRNAPLVVVHGDTLSTLISALAGRLAGGGVVHLESGLTSGRMFDPFPEEILRRLTFRLSNFALCPGDTASLRMSRYRCLDIVNTRENTLLDCVRYALKTISRANDGRSTYFVVSIHRVQNIFLRSRLSLIVREILSLTELGTVYFVLHPATRKRLESAGLLEHLSNASGMILQPRMSFTGFISLLASARGVLSDGGSNQEELSYLGVPTVLYRRRSERPQGLGQNVILRESISGDLPDFILSGKLDKLRSLPILYSELQPSRLAVEALLTWSRGAMLEKPA